MAYTGTASEIRFKQLLERTLEKNELSGQSPNVLHWAGDAASGWSFGIVQWDIANNLTGRSLLLSILQNARDGAGSFIVDDGNPNTDRLSDVEVARLNTGARQTGGQGLILSDQALINQCLSSAFGREAIENAYDAHFNGDLLRFNALVRASADARYQLFLDSDIGKLFVCDFANQYGRQNSRNSFKAYFSGGGGFDLFAIHTDFGVGDALQVYLRTPYNKNSPWDGMRRFANVVYQAGGLGSLSLDTARQLIQAYTFAYVANESRILSSDARVAAVNFFRRTICKPADEVVIADVKVTYKLQLIEASYDDVLIGDDKANQATSGEYQLSGREGNDIILGEAGDDTLESGSGDDTLIGGTGNDTLLGGSGTDTYVFKSGDGKDTITDSDGNGSIVAGGVTLSAGKIDYKNNDTWVKDGFTFKLDRAHAKLVITGDGLGAADANSITIQNFDASKTYLGLTLAADAKSAVVAAGTSNPFASASGAATSLSKTIGEKAAAAFDWFANVAASAQDTITIEAKNTGDAVFKLVTGAETLDLSSAQTLTLAAGQSERGFVIESDSDIAADQSVELVVTYNHDGQAVQSNTVTLNLKDSGETANTLNGDYTVKTETYKGSDRSRVNSVGVSTVVLRKDTQGYVRGDSLGSTLAADPNGVLVTDNVIYGSADADKINGLEGNDALTGNAGNDVIDGGAGDDLIGGGTGSDTIKGGDGNDFISSAANVQSGRQQMGPDDAWVTWGWKSGETILAKGATWGVTKKEGGSEYWDGMGNTITSDTAGDVVDAGAGNDHVFGSWGDDRIQGGEGDDALDGLAGADIIEGGDGVDVIRGDGMVVPRYLNSVAAQNHGADFIDGGAGDDSMEGQGGADEIFGGDGNDQIWGDSYGATDGQSYVAIQYHGDDYIDAESGDDYAEGGGGNDTLYGGEGNDVLWGDTSADLVTRPQDNAIWGNDTRLCHRRSKSICAPHKTHLPCIASVLRASPERGMV